MNTPNRKTKEEIQKAAAEYVRKLHADGIVHSGAFERKIQRQIFIAGAEYNQETSLSGNSAGVEKVKMFVSKTTSDSTFVRIVDGEREYKVEVFDDTICLHVYKSGEKEGSYYENIKSQPPLPTPTNQSDAVGILKELVELKWIHDNSMEDSEAQKDYQTRKPLAWGAARKYLQSLNK